MASLELQAPVNPPEGEDEGIDKPMCLAELAAVLLGVLGTLILISGLGFYTVTPPMKQCRLLLSRNIQLQLINRLHTHLPCT